jgi:hypothetical protein
LQHFFRQHRRSGAEVEDGHFFLFLKKFFYWGRGKGKSR